MKQEKGNNPGIMSAELMVKKKVNLTPHYTRVLLEGEVARFEKARAGDNNKILIPNSETGEHSVRTYTMRSLDLEKGEMAIDFVVHGDEGSASNWVINAKPGDTLEVRMKEKSKPLFNHANWFLILGDHTALPVISVILESLPKDALGSATIEVHGPEDILDLEKPNGVTIDWKYNSNPGSGSNLISALKVENIAQQESKFIFAAAEYSTIKEIQEVIRNLPEVSRDEWYAYSYWRSGLAEDASASERRNLKAK